VELLSQLPQDQHLFLAFSLAWRFEIGLPVTATEKPGRGRREGKNKEHAQNKLQAASYGAGMSIQGVPDSGQIVDCFRSFELSFTSTSTSTRKTT
jgi:hypothetical protein